MPYGERTLGKHWLRLLLLAWRHRAVTQNNVNSSSVGSCGIHLGAIEHEVIRISVTEMCYKIIQFTIKQPHLWGANRLIWVVNKLSSRSRHCVIFHFCDISSSHSTMLRIYWVSDHHDDVTTQKTLSVLQVLCEGNAPTTHGFPLQWAANAGFSYFLWCQSEQAVEQK